MEKFFHTLKTTYSFALAVLVVSSFFVSPLAIAASGTPTIISYQGRLTDASGNLLGGAGTTFYFKFSIWDNATVGSGTRLWPSNIPATTTASVRQGVFNVNIGDTANSYPDPLNYNFNTNKDIFLQVEVSSDNNSSETLSPRQRIGSASFAQLAGAVSGTTTPSSFGTTSPIGSSQVTIEATSTSAIPLSIRAAAGQLANLLNIEDSSGVKLIFSNATGGLFASSTFQSTGLATFFSGMFSNSSTSTITNLTTTLSTSTSATSTNFFSTTAVFTNATSTNFFATTASSTNLFATTLAVGGATLGNTTVGGTLGVTGAMTLSSTLSATGLSTLSGGILVNNATSTITNLTTVDSTTTNATTTNLAITNTASTSALTISNGFFQGGFSDCSLESQTVLYNSTTGKFSCGFDSTGGGGSELNWTYVATEADSSKGRIYVSTTTNQVVIGATATTSLAKLEVIGNQYISGNLGLGTTSPYTKLSVVGEVAAAFFTATTTVNSTFPNLISSNSTTTNATSTNFFSTTASSTNLFSTSLNTGLITSGAITSSGALALGGNTITSGAINSQTISSAANFTGTLAVANLSTLTGGFLSSASSTINANLVITG
ncbi:MAG: hypothetical protein AAB507_02420, partial [Patescibacteria group bacterium]